MSATRKICTIEELLAFRDEARRAGCAVVHCHGCFDIVHPGHIHHLEYARSIGDMLIVSVSADTHVNKGVNRPLIPDDLRARSLAALECVDAVYLNEMPTAVELLEKLRPDIFVKGREYEKSTDARFIRERETVERAGGRVVFSGGEVVYSSTALIDSLASTSRFDNEKLQRLVDRYSLTPDVLARIVDSFDGLKIVVAGDYILDRYHFCEALGLAGEAPVMSLRSIRRCEYDGGAGVIARHLAALGVQTTLVSNWADDEHSTHAERRLQAAGVTLRGLTTRRDTVVKERYLVEENKVLRVEEGAPAAMDVQAQRRFAETLLDVAGDADAVILADFGYGALGDSVCDIVMPALRAASKFVSADISGSQSNMLKFRGANLITPTEREARQTVSDFAGGLGAVVSNLLRKCDAREAMITLGRQGLLAYQQPTMTTDDGRLLSDYVPALSKHSIDPLGCGDALLATATAARAAGASLVAAALLGAYAAAVEVNEVGNVPMSSHRLLDLIGSTEASAEDLRLAV